jgi:pimeloyl-ACP methyl ester carboxylesterase
MPVSIQSGVATHYEVAGAGPPMVLLHATPYDHGMWLYQMAHFSTWFRVIAPDIRGFGRSDQVSEPFTFDDCVADIVALCEAEDVREAVLMGASVGSRLAFRLGHDRPDLFRAVVVVGGNAQASAQGAGDSSGSDQRREERIRRYAEGPFMDTYEWQLTNTLSPDFVPSPLGRYLTSLFSERALRLDGPAIARLFEALGYTDLRPLLGDISVPFLVVSGEHDRSIPGAREAASMIPDARHEIIPGAGHTCPIEDPTAFDALVIEFLTEKGAMPEIGV